MSVNLIFKIAAVGILVSVLCHRTTAFDSIEEGVRSMIENAEKEDVICATGSLYSIEEIRTCANREFHQNRGGCERL